MNNIQTFALRKRTGIIYRDFHDTLYCTKWYHKIVKWLVKTTKLQERHTVEDYSRVDIQLNKIPQSVTRELHKCEMSTKQPMTIIMGYDYYEQFIIGLDKNFMVNCFRLDKPQFLGVDIVCVPQMTGFIVIPYTLVKTR